MEPQVDQVAAARQAANEKLTALRAQREVALNTRINRFRDALEHPTDTFAQDTFLAADDVLKAASARYYGYAQIVAQAEDAHVHALQAADQALTSGGIQNLIGKGLEGETDLEKMQDVIHRAQVGYKAAVEEADEAYIRTVGQ